MSTSRNARNVSVIGLGMMGSALAAALLNAGHKDACLGHEYVCPRERALL